MGAPRAPNSRFGRAETELIVGAPLKLVSGQYGEDGNCLIPEIDLVTTEWIGFGATP